MKLDLTEERVRFDFPNATALYKFDERNNLSPTFHGAPMQAVDVMAEFKSFQLWIEIKEYSSEEIEEMRNVGGQQKSKDERNLKSYLTKNFKHKFRDTYLYRVCENKINSPIVYVCLTNFDDALNVFYRKELQKQLPAGKPTKRWQNELISKDHVWVVNELGWNRNFNVSFGTCNRY